MPSKRRAIDLCCAADGSGRHVPRTARVPDEQLRAASIPWYIQLSAHLAQVQPHVVNRRRCASRSALSCNHFPSGSDPNATASPLTCAQTCNSASVTDSPSCLRLKSVARRRTSRRRVHLMALTRPEPPNGRRSDGRRSMKWSVPPRFPYPRVTTIVRGSGLQLSRLHPRREPWLRLGLA